MTWQARLTRANATSLCSSAYYVRYNYQCIIFGLWSFCAYDFVCVWFVCVWFFCEYHFFWADDLCVYDFHDAAAVPVAYRKNSNKWTMYSDFLNFHLWKHRIRLLTLTFTWGEHVWLGARGSENRPVRPIPHAVPQLYGAFSNQSMAARHSQRL